MTEYNESDPRVNRYLTEGICPACKIPLKKVAVFMASCMSCDFVWRSKRVANIFPNKETRDGPSA